MGNLQFISLSLWQHHGDGAVWAGRDQVGEGESGAAAALSSGRRWAVLIGTRWTGRRLQWRALVTFWAKVPDGRKGTRDVCLPGMREWAHEQSPAEPTLHLEERDGRSTLNIHDRIKKVCGGNCLEWLHHQATHNFKRWESYLQFLHQYCATSQLLQRIISDSSTFSLMIRAHKSSYHKCTEHTLAIICIYCLFHHLLQNVSMWDV